VNSDFWINRWNENRTGFHQSQVNRHLQEHFPPLGIPPGSRILVPLCGKSLDMLWLHDSGYRITGIELSRIAVEAFFRENDLPFGMEQRGRFLRYSSGSLEILCGDFFDLRRDDIAGVAGVYDRAALIALPEPMRRRYADHLATLLPAGTKMLLIAIEYPQDELDGPPFAVPEEEVHHLYEENFDLHLLAVIDAPAIEYPRFRERGLTAPREKIFALERRRTEA